MNSGFTPVRPYLKTMVFRNKRQELVVPVLEVFMLFNLNPSKDQPDDDHHNNNKSDDFETDD